MNGEKPLRKTKRVPSRDSVFSVFIAGGLLLAVPLAAVLVIGEPCGSALLLESSCFASPIYRVLVGILPYLMIVGGILIAFNLKRISDSLLPNEQEDDAGEVL